jgi:S-adenosylhomocysteine hydrolase
MRRKLRQYILSRSFRDLQKAESVCLLSRGDLVNLASSNGSAVQVSDVPDVMRGEVLVDSRGEGSFQQQEKEEKRRIF